MTLELQVSQTLESRTRSDLYDEMRSVIKRIDLGVELYTHTILNNHLRDLIAAYKVAPIGG